jgi:hypothetical protein
MVADGTGLASVSVCPLWLLLHLVVHAALVARRMVDVLRS